MHAHPNYLSGSVLLGTRSQWSIERRLPITQKRLSQAPSLTDTWGGFGNSLHSQMDFLLLENIATFYGQKNQWNNPSVMDAKKMKCEEVWKGRWWRRWESHVPSAWQSISWCGGWLCVKKEKEKDCVCSERGVSSSCQKHFAPGDASAELFKRAHWLWNTQLA